MGPVLDTLSRPLRNLRLSVTDRCNLRCAYCMPEEEYVWLDKRDVLSFEELAFLVDRFGALGVTKVRLTGGEPLVRKDLAVLVAMLAQRAWLEDLALTTNGVLLAEQAQGLRAAGLRRLTVSLDTLDAGRFRTLTRRDSHGAVLEGISAAARAGFPAGLKLDTVVMRGVNDDELVRLLDYAASVGAELRFIEYMDVGGATRWRREDVVSRAELLVRLTEAFGPIEPIVEHSSAPAERFRLRDGRTFGIIASTTQPFCRACDRARVTADGTFFTCLYATEGLDLKAPLRAGLSAAELEALLRARWARRVDRGAEQRLALTARGPLATAQELKAEPRREMHTRGG
ncbi:MAG: GTP 3',8-cyclase MoaA [Myxococcaceae bacterium]|nr:GTP 3',8-cyclase MoaA [Myxococcaceae bacterium]